jgi:D-serine deaminase-like pyridoxal phosphate-dependent protein
MASRSLGTGELSAIETPALLLDLDVVERNLERMATRARQLGVQLRPHAKTHKCPELGLRQMAHGAVGLTVATLAEAEAFVDAGVKDITWAFPIDPTHIVHAQRIAARPNTTLRVITDDLATARALGGSGLHVWLKVDSGTHRAGVDPASPYALEVARELGREDGLVFDGILTHSGHAYRTRNHAEAAAVAEQERRIMVQFAQRLTAAGIPVRGISVGSTPAMSAVTDLTGVTEARPGNYVFCDRTMVLIGCCEPQDVGVTVLASVVSHQPGADHCVTDAGALALSKDLGPAHLDLAPSFGDVRGHTGLHVAAVSQEHGIVRGPPAALGALHVGDRIEIVPNHSCLTVANFDDYHVMRDGREIDRWRICRGR